MTTPILFFFSKIVLAILILVPFHIKFKISLSISTKCLSGTILEIVLKQLTSLRGTDIFTILDLSIHEHICLLIIWVFFNFFISILHFSACRFYTYFVRFIAKFLGGAIAHSIVFLMLNSNYH
ncbi:hypothetical protein EGM_04583 [Macaca fascicularis]|uniref:Uncharacterized protein n=1 Tax=Macaca fascicularis TaxID=9541 RepID=G7PLN7_MACFA|nr:hypothetical protein EGM_04583 [Macaca fascicularis]